MSDAIETAVIETPVVVPEAAEAPKDAASARRSIHERAMGRPKAEPVAQQVNATTDKPRDEQGRFAAVTETPAPEPSTAATAPAPDPATTEAAKAPSDANRIQIPDGHPLRDRGRQFYDELSQDEVRSLFTNPVRQREAEAARREAYELRAENARLKAESQAWRETSSQAFASPEVVANFYQIREVMGEAEAQRYLRGVQAEHETTVSTKANEATQQAETEYAAEQARYEGAQFMESAQSLAAARYAKSGWANTQGFADAFRKACFAYGAELQASRQMGIPAKANPNDLWKHMDALYLSDPSVRQFFTQQQQAEDEKRITEAAAAREREALDSAGTRRNINALGRLPAGSEPARLPTQSGPRNAAEALAQRKQRLRGVA